MRIIAEKDSYGCYKFIISYIIERIKTYRSLDGKPMCILLPTYTKLSAPLYRGLIEQYQNGTVSYKNIILFQLEEYTGISILDERSCASDLFHHFLCYVDIPHENVHFIHGDAKDVHKECDEFEQSIIDCGGIDLAICEVSSDGGIGGNEPGCGLKTRTRARMLSNFVFHDRSHVQCGFQDLDPKYFRTMDHHRYKHVVTMGMQTIMNCYEVIVYFLGITRSRALHHCVEGCIHNMFPASIFQMHERPCLVADEPALSELRCHTLNYYKGLMATYEAVHQYNININTEESTPYLTANKWADFHLPPHVLDTSVILPPKKYPFISNYKTSTTMTHIMRNTISDPSQGHSRTTMDIDNKNIPTILTTLTEQLTSQTLSENQKLFHAYISPIENNMYYFLTPPNVSTTSTPHSIHSYNSIPTISPSSSSSSPLSTSLYSSSSITSTSSFNHNHLYNKSNSIHSKDSTINTSNNQITLTNNNNNKSINESSDYNNKRIKQ
ncbi:hypothetical protein WA158_008160 [Blastocystis sp. Blastoise]